MFPEAKSVYNWIRYGWHVVLAYVLGFAVLVALHGWDPLPPHKVGQGVQNDIPEIEIKGPVH